MSPAAPASTRTSNRGRSFNATRPLGKLMVANGWNCRDVERMTDIYSRTLSDYLAGRKPFTVQHARQICEGLGCRPEDILSPGELPV